MYRTLPEFLVTVADGLDRNFTTEQIAAEVGVQYSSVLTRLNRAGEYATAKRMQIRRKREWEARRPDITAVANTNRCKHGTWTSIPGQCTHATIRRAA